MSFPASLEIVYESLLQIREQHGGELRASSESLTKLIQAISPTIKSVPTTVVPIEKPSVKEALKMSDERMVAPVVLNDDDTSTVISQPKEKASRWTELRTRTMGCEKCPSLASKRNQVVFGSGAIDAELMFVGEAPSEEDDRKGEPFVDAAGQLLTKIIETMGFKRSDVYIATVVKCHPDVPAGATGNKKPKPEEIKACFPYLVEQIEMIRPKLLVALGATAMEALTGNKEMIGHLRGHWHEFKGIPLMPTYHPAYLQHKQALSEKRKVWEDMLRVLERLNQPITEKQRRFFLPKSNV